MMKIAVLMLALLSGEEVRSRPARGGTEFRIPLPSKAYPAESVLQVSAYPRVRRCTYRSPEIREEWGEAIFSDRVRPAKEIRVWVAQPGEYLLRIACLPRHQTNVRMSAAMKKGLRFPRIEFIALAGTPEERLERIIRSADRLMIATAVVSALASERRRKNFQGLSRLIHELRKMRGRCPLTAACEYSETWVEAVHGGLAFEHRRKPRAPRKDAAPGGRAVDDDTPEGAEEGQGQRRVGRVRKCEGPKPRVVDVGHLRTMIGRECALLLLREAERWLDDLATEPAKRLETRLSLLETTCVTLIDRHPGFKPCAPAIQALTADLRNLLREEAPSEATVEAMRAKIEKQRSCLSAGTDR